MTTSSHFTFYLHTEVYKSLDRVEILVTLMLCKSQSLIKTERLTLQFRVTHTLTHNADI